MKEAAPQPTYYVQHPDGSYSIAEPQPTLLQGSIARQIRNLTKKLALARSTAIAVPEKESKTL